MPVRVKAADVAHLLPAEAPGLPVARRNKYRAVPTYHGGLRYDSRAEGLIRGWTRQVPFRLGPAGIIYRADFLVFDTDGFSYVIEVKGVETPRWRVIRKLWRAHGPCPLMVVTRAGREVMEGGYAQ